MKVRLLIAATLAGIAPFSAIMAGASAAAPTKPAKSSSSSPAPLEPDATAPASSATSTYRVSAGDQVEIYVWGDERLQRTLSVLPDGTFSFPLAGTIVAAGRTTNQLETELSRLLAPQYKGIAPQVTVSVRQTSGMQISMIGKVRSPGTITPIRYVTVLDALGMVGGPGDFADVNNIIVLRHEDGKLKVMRTHIGNVLKGKPSPGDLSGEGNPELKSGDTVVVP